MTASATRCAAIAREPAFDAWQAQSRKRSGSKRLGRIMTVRGFESGGEALDRYFRTQAGQDARKNMAAPLCPGAAGRDDRRLLHALVDVCAARRTPGPNGAEAAEIAARAGDAPGPARGGSAATGKGYGRFLLADALCRAIRSEIASFAVIVDAKDDNARRFYERESFLPFPDQPMKLFRPIAEIRKLFV